MLGESLGCLPAGFFVIFFNILSSFYWSGKYLVLTSYKSRLLLNIRWIYLLAKCSVCAAVESQVVPFAWKGAEPQGMSPGAQEPGTGEGVPKITL